MTNYPKILGVIIDDYDKQVFLKRLDSCLKFGTEKLFIVTLNPEIVLKTTKDKDYQTIINQADIRVIDGIGLQLVSVLKGIRCGERLTGTDLAYKIITANKKLKSAFILREDGLTGQAILSNWCQQQGISKNNFIVIPFDIKRIDDIFYIEEVVKRIFDAKIILVGLGAPYQEKLIWKIKDHLPQGYIFIGVGGAFDYWTGTVCRAPVWMRRIGLEWFFRLLLQPQRTSRIWQSTAVFLYKALIKEPLTIFINRFKKFKMF
jgi:N-acetylglucosaminyldiphosphoundecaprenol N-acetyl-beta-D-mannosaminyltransferase